MLQTLRFVSGAEDIRIRGISLLCAVAVRKIVGNEPFRHFLAPAEFGDEILIEPRLINTKLWICEQTITIETFDVIALVSRAIAPDGDAILQHCADQHRAGDSAAEWCGVEILLTARADVESAASDCSETFFNQRALAIN